MKHIIRKRILAIALILVMSAAILSGCAGTKGQSQAGKFDGTIRIIYQNGMSYAPFYVMEEKKLIEKYLPGVKVEWSILGSGSAISEALMADRADVGIMGIAPLLIARDKGASYKLFSGLINSPLSLVVMNDKYKSLKDFGAVDKIAVPAPGSIQHILLSMAAEKELGDPKALEKNVVGMAHPDAMTALINGVDLVGHFSSSPYLFEEVNKGGKIVVDGFEAFGGDFTFLGTVATKRFMENSPAYAASVFMALGDAIQLVNTKDPSTIDIIAKKENLTADKVKEYLDWEGTNYTTTPYGSMKIAEFMKNAGYIKNVPASLDDFCWNTVTSILGKRAGAPSLLEEAQKLK